MQLHPDQIARRTARFQRRARLVGWAKIVLPVVAVAVIAAIFFASRDRGDVTDLFTPEEIARLGAGLQLDNPRLAGVTDADQPYELTARTATPDGPMADRVSFVNPEGSIEMEDRRLSASADSGMLDREAEKLELDGSVVLETSDGWRAETGRLEVDMASRSAKSAGAVAASGPNGTLEAGSFRAEYPEDDKTGPRIWFEKRVRVVFTPRADE